MIPGVAGAGGAGGGNWAVQQLAGMLAGISAYDDEQGMLVGAAHRIAEAIDAEVCAITDAAGDVSAAIGFPADAVPTEQLRAATESARTCIDVPGIGEVPTAVVDLGDDAGRVVVARSGSPITATDLHLVRSMGQVLTLALQLRRTADRERELRRQSEQQATALRRANAALVEASRTKDMVISVASHELRTPLTAILGFASTMRERADQLDESARATYLEIIESQGNRLLRLIDDLLTVGRIGAGRARPHATSVGVVAALRVMTAANDTDVDIRGPVDATALVDPGHLDQMVLNLVNNARKYGAPPITIEVAQAESEVSVTVTDAGPGIPEAFVPHLFDRFTQASTGEARSSSGAGLGLAIVRGLAQANGGDVEYHHEARRTSFTIRLPAAGPDEQRRGDDPDAASTAPPGPDRPEVP